MSLDKTSQMNLDLENMNNNLSQENFTPVFDDDDDSLSIVDLYLDNQPVTETSARDIAETSARELYILSGPILADLQTRSLLFAIYVAPDIVKPLESAQLNAILKLTIKETMIDSSQH
ncbi:12861_t:CDS:2 [Cetraspora pellucida]|uniref:12861_t:CDS:1 n=1 Tax=Cetraspora pellucida TaxID=1433469 RepID=A0ACA9L725_9GLOM|nr:12861_t:CDS:2 [Cetraspora pellucida]